MSEQIRKMLNLVDMLPETEQNLIREMIKRIVLAWDSDFTKVTPEERQQIEMAEKELANGEYLTHKDVWSDLE